MKTSSKPSILSPGRVPDPAISLPTSLSRRLRTSGSLRNGQASPMFPTAGNKKKFENPEPSSPKVTCIGQVRVKTKKHGNRMRNNLSRRPSSDMSFRRNEHNQMQRQFSVNSQYHNQECSSSHRNQRWVHLPLSVCESLRGFGSEFSCLFPCKSSCFSKDGERVGRRRSSSCGDVFANWLVALEDDDDNGAFEKRRDVDLVVEDEGSVVRRRHVFDEIEIKDCYEERGRVSVCVPPKNALLLMRCRSDPVKMEALASKFWESTHLDDEEGACNDANIVRYIEEQEEEKAMVNLENVEVNEEVVEKNVEVFEERRALVFSKLDQVIEEEKQVDMKLEVEVEVKEEGELIDEEMHVSLEEEEKSEEVDPFEDLQSNEEAHEQEELLEDLQSKEEAHVCDQEEEEAAADLQSNEKAQVVEQEDTEWVKKIVEDEEENESSFVTAALEVVVNQGNEQFVEGEEGSVSCSFESFAFNSDDEINKPDKNEQPQQQDCGGESNDAVEKVCEDIYTHTEVVVIENVQIQEGELQVEEKRVDDIVEEEEKMNVLVLESESDEEINNKEEKQTPPPVLLPDCLLLMMCEPKLSMEVSKETWVCSTDFIRRRRPFHAPPDQHKNSGAGDEVPVTEKMTSVGDNKFNNTLLPPPYAARLSCCLPTAKGCVPMGKKLVDAVGYEPFVLTRCKSEPTRTAAQEACFWKNRAMDPPRYRVGATGVGC